MIETKCTGGRSRAEYQAAVGEAVFGTESDWRIYDLLHSGQIISKLVWVLTLDERRINILIRRASGFMQSLTCRSVQVGLSREEWL